MSNKPASTDLLEELLPSKPLVVSPAELANGASSRGMVGPECPGLTLVRQQLLEQVKRDVDTLNSDIVEVLVPGREFFEERIRNYRSDLMELGDA